MLTPNKKVPPSSIHYRSWVLAKFPTPHCYATSCFAVTPRVTPLSILQPLSYNDVSEGETCNYSTILTAWQGINDVSSLVFVSNLISEIVTLIYSLFLCVYECILHVMAGLVTWTFPQCLWTTLTATDQSHLARSGLIYSLTSFLYGVPDQCALEPPISGFLKRVFFLTFDESPWTKDLLVSRLTTVCPETAELSWRFEDAHKQHDDISSPGNRYKKICFHTSLLESALMIWTLMNVFVCVI